MSDAATEHCLAIGAENMMSPDQDYQPLFRVAPEYPVQLLSRLEEGYVNLAVTVDANGFVQDPVPIDRQGNSAFERAATKAVERFRYAPQFKKGEPVAVNDVRTLFSFKISD